MTNYYIEKDNKIIFVDTDLERLQNTIIGQDLTILETERPIVNFEFADTPEYLAKKFQSDIQYQHDAFNEYAREIVYQIQYNTALSNTTLILNLEEQLKAEQEAVIARINAITEEYNNEQST